MGNGEFVGLHLQIVIQQDVYDEIGQLRFVLSPTYQKNGKKAISAYEYRYDYRGRVVKKTLLGCEYIQYWYDKADRLICMQDGMMREQRLYRFTVYDCLLRLSQYRL